MNGDEKKLMTLREADREIKRIAAEGFDAGYDWNNGESPFDDGTFEHEVWEQAFGAGSFKRIEDESWKRYYKYISEQNAVWIEEYRLRKENKKWYQFWI